jgi:F420-dependent methylenetetrahydromethanopterin dehydrogenase
MQPRCIRLRDLRNLRENIHVRVLNLSAQMKPQYLPQIPLIHADETQNSNN